MRTCTLLGGTLPARGCSSAGTTCRRQRSRRRRRSPSRRHLQPRQVAASAPAAGSPCSNGLSARTGPPVRARPPAGPSVSDRAPAGPRTGRAPTGPPVPCRRSSFLHRAYSRAARRSAAPPPPWALGWQRGAARSAAYPYGFRGRPVTRPAA
eukprot:scaffold19903_cov64-Phaeocystis_antarctica.AAC.12